MSSNTNQSRMGNTTKRTQDTPTSTRSDVMEEDQQEQLQNLRLQLEKSTKQMGEAIARCQDLETTQRQLIKDSICIMADQQEKLQELRTDMEEKEEELKSFKDRVAMEVATSIKTSFDSLNSPVNQERLKESYESLWQEIEQITRKVEWMDREEMKKLIKGNFEEAENNMKDLKHDLEKHLDSNKPKHGKSKKAKEHVKLAVQNLQLAIYFEEYDNYVKQCLSKSGDLKKEEILPYLGQKCLWLGKLMALHNPPLHPDWENHDSEVSRPALTYKKH